MEYAIGFIFRYVHVLAGITWIGMLYYFNFVQTEYFKEAEAEAKKDAMAKLEGIQMFQKLASNLKLYLLR